MAARVKQDKFHGRIDSDRPCQRPGCPERGEFRAPGPRASGFDGPGDYRWFCLEHVREFNAGYDWFAGMSQDEILAAQSPLAGWERETRAFRADAAASAAPRWADFTDPLDAISARAREFMNRADAQARGAAQRAMSPEDRRAYEALGLDHGADRKALRQRYSQLVRRYHPDRNGGDRSHEARLQAVVEAYQHLRGKPQFG